MVNYSNLQHCSVRPLEILEMIKHMMAYNEKPVLCNEKLLSIIERCRHISPSCWEGDKPSSDSAKKQQ